jgi:hypothetical protein
LQHEVEALRRPVGKQAEQNKLNVNIGLVLSSWKSSVDDQKVWYTENTKGTRKPGGNERFTSQSDK